LTQLLADENIPSETVKLPKRQGIDIISVTEFAYGLSDRKILELGKTKERIIVTFDKDFGQIIFKEKIKTKGVILLRFIPKSPQQISKRIQQLLSAKIKIENCLVVVKKDRIKVTPAR